MQLEIDEPPHYVDGERPSLSARAGRAMPSRTNWQPKKMPSTLKPYDAVRIATDRFREDGVAPGAIGVVIEGPRDRWLLVEVSRPDGATIAIVSARPDELELVDRASLGPPPELSAVDKKAFDALREGGMDFHSPKRIDHYLCFSSQAVAEEAAQELRLAKYRVQVDPSSKDDEWQICASHTTLLDARLLAGTVVAMRKIAVSFGGRHDRWEARSLE